MKIPRWFFCLFLIFLVGCNRKVNWGTSSPPTAVMSTTQASSLVVRVGEKKLYLLDANRKTLTIFSIGGDLQKTPLGDFAITAKNKPQQWKSIKTGKVSPWLDIMGAPEWIAFYTAPNGLVLGFHGDKSGEAAGWGCIRMAPANLTNLYNRIEIGTPVSVQR
jgi:lipoprotein-anchoring transpeptidase ErfK/SrfK